jgi:hypothetical protein
MLIDFLKNIMYVFVICVFLYLILGQTVVEGMEGEASSTDAPSSSSDAPSLSTDAPSSSTDAPSLSTDAPLSSTVEESERPTKVTSSDVSELFERVNRQSDVIRTFKGLFTPIVPLKIDGTGDQRIILLKNIKLLLNNGVFKNETDLKDYEYFGNKAINTLVSEVNNLNLESPASILDIDKKEVDYANRTREIIEEHKKIIDLELKRRAK